MYGSWAVGILLALAVPAAARAQEFPGFDPDDERAGALDDRPPNLGYGPFSYGSLAPIPSLRSGFTTRFPSSLPEGGFEVRVAESWVRTFSVTNRVEMDFDIARTNIAFSWGLSEEFRLDLEIEGAERTGSRLDAFILGFHHVFGIPPGGRDQFARNGNHLSIQPPEGGPRIVVDENDPQPYEQAAVLTLHHTFTFGDEDWPAVSWSASLRGNLHQGDLSGGSPVDLSASVGLVKEFETLHVFLGGNVQWFGREDFFGLKLRTLAWSATAGVEWNLLEDFSLVAQYMATSGGVDDLGALSRPSHEVVAGFKWRVFARVLIEFGVIENVINFDNGPDFGVQVGVTFRW